MVTSEYSPSRISQRQAEYSRNPPKAAAVQRRKKGLPLSTSIHAQIGVLVIATSLVQLANGFFGTFISLRVAIENFDVPGLVLSAYFAGFTLGAFRCNRIIERIGHIRAYAAFAGAVAAAVAIMPLLIGSLAWASPARDRWLRLCGDFRNNRKLANRKGPPSERGQVFSIYMVGTFLSRPGPNFDSARRHQRRGQRSTRS